MARLSTYRVTLLELHYKLFVTLVRVKHFLFARIKQDLDRANTLVR